MGHAHRQILNLAFREFQLHIVVQRASDAKDGTNVLYLLKIRRDAHQPRTQTLGSSPANRHRAGKSSTSMPNSFLPGYVDLQQIS